MYSDRLSGSDTVVITVVCIAVVLLVRFALAYVIRLNTRVAERLTKKVTDLDADSDRIVVKRILTVENRDSLWAKNALEQSMVEAKVPDPVPASRRSGKVIR